jgi:hypothetical protein
VKNEDEKFYRKFSFCSFLQKLAVLQKSRNCQSHSIELLHHVSFLLQLCKFSNPSNFFRSPNQVQVYNVNNFHDILNHPAFSRDRNSVIYHYGFTQTPETQSVMEVIQAYLSFGDVNFILVNYESVTTNTLPVNNGKQRNEIT